MGYMDYLTSRPQYVRLENELWHKRTPRHKFVNILIPTSNSRLSWTSCCHLQFFSDDSAFVGYILKDNLLSTERKLMTNGMENPLILWSGRFKRRKKKAVH